MAWITALMLSFLYPARSPGAITQADCPGVDLSGCFGPNRGSGGAEWCWANTAADLIGCAQGVRPPDRISTIDVASAQLNVTSGDLYKAAESVDDKELSASVPWYVADTKSSRKDLTTGPISGVRGNTSSAILAYQSRSGYCLEKDFGVATEPSNSYILAYLQSVYRRPAGNDASTFKLNDCDYDGALSQLQKFNWEMNRKILARIDRELLDGCRRRVPMKPMLPAVVDLDNPRRNATDILRLAFTQKMPVAIGFDSNLLVGKPYLRSVNHGAIVIGSRWNGGTCEFRIRDGNGADCSIYGPDIRPRCENGNIWLSEREINESTGSIMAVDKKR